jgi:hypothetical protein
VEPREGVFMSLFGRLKKILANIAFIFKNNNIGHNSGNIGDNSGNINTGTNHGILGNDNTININSQPQPTRELVEQELLKLEHGDLINITDEVDSRHREKNVVIWSCNKNYQLQLKQQIMHDDFDGEWIPKVPADMGGREKKPYLQITPVYQNVVLPFSYFFILIDGLRYHVPLPERDRNNSVNRYTITKVQYHLGKILTDGECYNTSYDEMLKQCKIEVDNVKMPR